MSPLEKILGAPLKESNEICKLPTLKGMRHHMDIRLILGFIPPPPPAERKPTPSPYLNRWCDRHQTCHTYLRGQKCEVFSRKKMQSAEKCLR